VRLRCAARPIVAAGVLILAGCRSDAPSPAADAYIAQASDDEEREGLAQARDDVDAEMRAVAAARDAEIARLKKENEELKARVESLGRK
jgi:hypothetical protein